jgi:hypothetical protein
MLAGMKEVRGLSYSATTVEISMEAPENTEDRTTI